ncbi:glycolate oxidase subunit GlcF [Chitinimonas viridis]|uniref:Glycolate oxidase iron-sulfur subunit n=1 Tax=Chitinimonas viridis TaxID=664880 RepID=A0ABT8B162_9NEIS|nr:glycolate oxidase subunit GlcF [Chitinimonas viridis]MDN3575560.1 glycolate oxidase subunit GlcF [Chitinimonas viridis]
MQTQLTAHYISTTEGQEADAILRRCVHCGFCLATCPTYQLSGNELDSPRGRIYLIKQLLEGQPASRSTQQHLDRCLSCRACETTCPSGVAYHRLADIGRHALEAQLGRPLLEGFKRSLLKRVLRNRPLFGGLVMLGRLSRPLLPKRLASIPRLGDTRRPPPRAGRPRWLMLEGCVQPALAPAINAAAARVLAACGIDLQALSGCCGALAWHLNDAADGLADMRRMVAQADHALAQGAAGVVYTASGCGASVVEYGQLLAGDMAHAAAAARVSASALDISDLVLQHLDQLLPQLQPPADPRLVFHAPCSLQHGLHKKTSAEAMLVRLGYVLLPIADANLCCGSAGSYSILQADIASQLRSDKLAKLQAGQPSQIATANIGCQTHLQAGTRTPIRHWIELIAERLS